MGKSNVPLTDRNTLVSQADRLGQSLFGSGQLKIMGWDVATRDAAMLLLIPALVILVSVLLFLFFRTNLGTAMRATRRQCADDSRHGRGRWPDGHSRAGAFQ